MAYQKMHCNERNSLIIISSKNQKKSIDSEACKWHLFLVASYIDSVERVKNFSIWILFEIDCFSILRLFTWSTILPLSAIGWSTKNPSLTWRSDQVRIFGPQKPFEGSRSIRARVKFCCPVSQCISVIRPLSPCRWRWTTVGFYLGWSRFVKEQLPQNISSDNENWDCLKRWFFVLSLYWHDKIHLSVLLT